MACHSGGKENSKHQCNQYAFQRHQFPSRQFSSLWWKSFSQSSLCVVHLLKSRERVTLKLTCDKLCSLLEVGKYEVGHYVEACKQEHTDLQKRQKAIWFVIFASHSLRTLCSLVNKLSCSVQYYWWATHLFRLAHISDLVYILIGGGWICSTDTKIIRKKQKRHKERRWPAYVHGYNRFVPNRICSVLFCADKQQEINKTGYVLLWMPKPFIILPRPRGTDGVWTYHFIPTKSKMGDSDKLGRIKRT